MTTYRQPKAYGFNTESLTKPNTVNKRGFFYDDAGTRKFAFGTWLAGKFEEFLGKSRVDWTPEEEKKFQEIKKQQIDDEIESKKFGKDKFTKSLLSGIDDMDSGDEEGRELAKLNEQFGVWDGDKDKTIWELYEDATPKEDTAGWNELDLIAERNLNQRQADTEADALVQSYQGSVYDVDAPDMVTQDSSKSKEVSPEMAIQAAGLLNEMFNKPDEAPTQIRGAGIHSGRVPFPSLLASSQRQPDPRYVNKGLI